MKPSPLADTSFCGLVGAAHACARWERESVAPTGTPPAPDTGTSQWSSTNQTKWPDELIS